MPKTTIEKIESVKAQIQQLENERKRLMNLQKESERKARTKRLIERGAILESLISGADQLTNAQIKTFLEKTIQTDFAHRVLCSLTSQGNGLAASTPTGAHPQSGIAPTDESASMAQGTG